MMARRDPWVNMLRTTMACAGAAFGGADAITVLPFTWALGKPDAFARRIARNTHLVLQEESARGRVIDPAARRLVHREADRTSWPGRPGTLFQEIEAKGGMAAALESGFIQGEIAPVAEARAKDIAVGRVELTGVSAFPMLADDGVKVEPHPEPDPIVKGGTSSHAARAAPSGRAVRAAARRRRRASWPRPASGRRCSSPRSAISRCMPTRSTWMQEFSRRRRHRGASASEPLHNSADAGKAFADSGAAIACICSSDQVYAELGEATAGVLKTAGASRCCLPAGRRSRSGAQGRRRRHVHLRRRRCHRHADEAARGAGRARVIRPEQWQGSPLALL